MNKDYIMNKIKPYLSTQGMLCENDFNALFSMLTKQQQYEIINILIEMNIDINYNNLNSQEVIKSKSNEGAFDYQVKLKNISNEQLCVIYQQGNKLALDAIVGNNIKLVWSRVKKYSGRYKHKLDEEDLVQYGIIGLIEAVKKFDLNREAKFITYAVWWIDQKILRSIADYGFTVRLPVHYFEQVNKMLRILRQNPNATKQEIFNLVKDEGMNRERFEEIFMIIENIMSLTSLNTLVGEGEDTELGDLKVDDLSPTVEEEVEYMQLKEIINSVLDSLTERQKDVIELRFGLKDGIEMTLEEVGIKYNLTRERIRQIEVKALKRLRNSSRINNLSDFI